MKEKVKDNNSLDEADKEEAESLSQTSIDARLRHSLVQALSEIL